MLRSGVYSIYSVINDIKSLAEVDTNIQNRPANVPQLIKKV